MKNYSMSEKYKYFCKMSKKGSCDSNGRSLTDFERGVYMGKALMIQLFAKWDKNRKTKVSNSKRKDENFNANKGLFTHNYSDEELATSFDNLKDFH